MESEVVLRELIKIAQSTQALRVMGLKRAVGLLEIALILAHEDCCEADETATCTGRAPRDRMN